MKLLPMRQIGLATLLAAALGATALAPAPAYARDFGWGPARSSHHSGVQHKHHRHDVRFKHHKRHDKHLTYHGRIKPEMKYDYGWRHERPYARHKHHYRDWRWPYERGYYGYRDDDPFDLSDYWYDDGRSIFYYE